MNDGLLLEHLERIADRLGVEVRYENLTQSGFRSEGGYCRVLGKDLILLNRRDTCRRKIRILARSLNRLNLEGIFVPPAVRRIIESEPSA